MMRSGGFNGFVIGAILFSVLWPGPAMPQDTPEQTVRRVCGSCHALEVNRLCLAGDCQGLRVHRTQSRDWVMVLGWMREAFGCRMTDGEFETIGRYLNGLSPLKKPYPHTWKKAGIIPGGWNVVSLTADGDVLYAGVEGNGMIYRTTDGLRWAEVARTGHVTVYGITRFQGALYAGTNNPDPEIWTSPEGVHWNPAAHLPSEDRGVISMGVFKGFLYAGTGRARIYRSRDGKRWDAAGTLEAGTVAGFPAWVRFLVEFHGRLYAGIESGKLYRTEDGVHWTEVAPTVTQSGGVRGAAVFQNALYVGTTRTGHIWKTGDGILWDDVFDATTRRPGKYVGSMAVYQDALYAAVNGFIFRTKNGRNWDEVGNLSALSIEAMTPFQGSFYVGTTMPPSAWIFRTEENGKP
ncbi:MAG TPA: hypothetical protein VLY20_01675 [Nitrospiria bacterium]|nr:hypothetical protein [Nitrospiria bacterium]